MAVMSKSETELIVDSWALAQPDLHKHGLEFFIRLFSEHPDVQTKHFPQMDVNEIDTLSKHGYRVMRAVDTMVLHVKNSDDESLVAKIHEVTFNHRKRGIASTKDYEIVCDILHAYLAIALGSNLSGEGAQAWRKLLDTLIAVVGQELIRLENEEKEKKRQLFKN